jgi:hypothetical protein
MSLKIVSLTFRLPFKRAYKSRILVLNGTEGPSGIALLYIGVLRQ